MLRNILKVAASIMMNRWLSPQFSPGSASAASPVHLNTPQIKLLAIKLVSLAVLAFLNFLLFVGGVIVTAVATAHSFDVLGEFQATSVFWTGIVMAGTAFVLGAVGAWALLSTKITMHDLVIQTIEPEMEAPSLAERFVRPAFEGVLAGFARPRTHRRESEERTYHSA